MNISMINGMKMYRCKTILVIIDINDYCSNPKVYYCIFITQVIKDVNFCFLGFGVEIN